MRVIIPLFLVVGCLICSACTERNPLYCGDGECIDPAAPFCDKDGFIAGTKDACIAVSCAGPDAFVSCKEGKAISCNDTMDAYEIASCDNGCNDASQGCNLCSPNGAFCTATSVQHCGADGQPSSAESCAGGCVDQPAPHCAYISPVFLPNICDAPASETVTISASATLGTDLDSACSGGVVMQNAAPEICVVRAKSISLEQNATLKIVGKRAIAFVADDLVQIGGVLDVSADADVHGPGGGLVESGGISGSPSGGGGAGFKTTGAAGGNATADGGAANGGGAQTNPAQLSVLVGGTKNYGGAGGALMLVACRGSVVVDGLIDAGGGGGWGGTPPEPFARGGAGGGSGGNVVLQGMQITVTGKLFANGGAGGAGYTGSANGAAGLDGGRYIGAATGGLAQGSGGGGGNGGFAGGMPTVGKMRVATGGTAGGGGGSVGFLQTYTPSGVDPTLTPQEVSPAFEPNLVVPTR